MIEKLPELLFSDGNSQEKNSCFGFYCAQINAWDLTEMFYFNEITWGLMWWQRHYLSCSHFCRQLTQNLIKHWNHIYLLCVPTSQQDCQSSCLFFIFYNEQTMSMIASIFVYALKLFGSEYDFPV